MDVEKEHRVGWRQLICCGEKILFLLKVKKEKELFSLLINHRFEC